MIARGLPVIAALATVARADDWEDERQGVVFEASLGGGGVYHGPWGPLLSVLQRGSSVPSFAAVAAAGSAGVGAWLDPRIALTARAFAMGFRSSSLAAFVGPDLQYWLPPLSGAFTGRPTLWLGGGIGAALAKPVAAGLGLDVRMGVAIGALQVSIEGSEGIYFGGVGNSVTLGAALLVGYQFL